MVAEALAEAGTGQRTRGLRDRPEISFWQRLQERAAQALRELACSVGIEHRGWFNMGSTWYGDGRRVRNLAKLTLALNKYGRAQMFGPGTTCR